MYQAPLRVDIPIADRTGGGDSFASGVLAGLLQGKDLETAVQWGAAHGILVQETPGDITMIESKAVLAEVKRALGGASYPNPFAFKRYLSKVTNTEP
jgi:2-dehydro-3-deoxygluconokinase